MNSASRDSYGITVKGTHARSILPEKVVDVGRFDIRIDAEGVIEGGALCTNVEGTGTPFRIDGSLLALGSVRFAAGSSGVGVIHGPTMVNESLLMESKDRTGVTYRIVGDLSAQKVNLKNTVVYGNVMGNNVTLTNCLVFGVVNAENHLKMQDSMAFTFSAGNAELCGKICLLNCSASVTEKLSIAGEILSLAFSLWDQQDVTRGKMVKLGPEDIKTVKCEKMDGRKETKHIFSCYDRIVDVAKLGTLAAQNINWVEERLIKIVEDRTGGVAQDVERVFLQQFTAREETE